MNWRSVVATCVVLCAASAQAQFDSAQMSGVVQDATGAVLPGVDVTLINVGTSIERQDGDQRGRALHVPERAGRRIPRHGDALGLQAGHQDRRARQRRASTSGLTSRSRSARCRETVQVEAADDARRHVGHRPHRPGGADRRDAAQRTARLAGRAARAGVVGGNMGGSVPTGTGTFATGVTSINGGRADEFMTTVDGAPSIRVRAGRRLHDGRAELRHRRRSAGADDQLPGGVRPRRRPGSCGSSPRAARRASAATSSGATRTMRSTRTPGRASEPGSRSRRTTTTPTASRSAGPSTFPGRSTRIEQKLFFFWGEEWQRDRIGRESRWASCRPRRCGTATSARCCPAASIRDPQTGLPFPGNIIPAGPHQPAGPGAAQRLPAADSRIPAGREQLDRQPGGLQQPAEGQHQDRLRPDAPTIVWPCGTRGRRTSGTIPSRWACTRRSGTTRAARWPRR